MQNVEVQTRTSVQLGRCCPSMKLLRGASTDRVSWPAKTLRQVRAAPPWRIGAAENYVKEGGAMGDLGHTRCDP